MGVIVADWDFTQAADAGHAAASFASARFPAFGWLESLPSTLAEWLSQPEIYSALIAWAVTFTLIMILVLATGFGPAGVIPGTVAAAFQSWAYGAFTPAGGLFASMTSLAMLGLLAPAVAGVAATVATIVAIAVWGLSVGG